MHLFNLFVTIGRLLSFIPWEFGNTEILGQIIYSLLVSILISVNIFLSKFDNPMQQGPIIFISHSLLLMLIFQSVFRSTVWKQLLRLNVLTTSQLRNLGKSSKINLVTVLLFIWNLFLALSGQLVLYFSSERTPIFLLPIPYILFFAKYLPILFLHVLKEHFETLNKHLENNMETLPIALDDRNKLLLCKKIYHNLFIMSDCLNKIFGWFIVIFFGELLVAICRRLHYFVNVLFGEQGHDSHILYFCLSYGCRMVSLFCLMITCRKFVSLLCLFNAFYDSRIK